MRNRFQSYFEQRLLHTLYVDDAGGSPAGGGVPPPSSTAPTPATPAPSAPAAPPATPAAPAPDGKPAATVAEAGGAPPLIDKNAAPPAVDPAKPGDPAKPADAAPAEIEFKAPDGVTIDEKTAGEFKALLSDEKLTPSERAQKLVDMHVSAMKAIAEAPQKAWSDLNSKWQAEVKADKELGGTNFDAMRSTIAKAITDVGGPDANAVFEALHMTGAANNPAIVRMFYRMSRAFVEGSAVSGNPAGEKAKGFASAVASMYPSATGNKEPASA